MSAFQQVADVLIALGSDRELADAQGRSLATSQKLLKLQRLSYCVGKSDLPQLLDAQRSYQQARLAPARARAAVYQDAAQPLVAMGGAGGGRLVARAGPGASRQGCGRRADRRHVEASGSRRGHKGPASAPGQGRIDRVVSGVTGTAACPLVSSAPAA